MDEVERVMSEGGATDNITGFSMVVNGWWFNIVGGIGDLFDFARLTRNGDTALVTLVMPRSSFDELEWTESFYSDVEPEIRTEHLGSANMLREKLMTMMNEGWQPQHAQRV